MDEKNKDLNEAIENESKKAKKDKKKNSGIKLKKGFKVKGKYASSLYMAVAVCMVAVIGLSVVSINYNYSDKLNEIDLSFPEISIPDYSINVPSPTEQSADLKSGTVSEDRHEEVDNKPDQAVDAITYASPASGKIIKGYHGETLVFSETMNDFRTHNGVDIAAEIGSAVYAYTDGVVSAIGDDPFMGKTIEITHDFGLKSYYKNLAETVPLNIKVGTEVSTGDIIGAVGATAIVECEDEPHLHFELWVENECINSEKELALINE